MSAINSLEVRQILGDPSPWAVKFYYLIQVAVIIFMVPFHFSFNSRAMTFEMPRCGDVIGDICGRLPYYFLLVNIVHYPHRGLTICHIELILRLQVYRRVK
jgi:hypothetical protein